jgi:hypothetical protein
MDGRVKPGHDDSYSGDHLTPTESSRPSPGDAEEVKAVILRCEHLPASKDDGL